MIDWINLLKTTWEWIIVIIVIGIIYYRNKKRGYFWKAKDGRQLTLNEFFKSWGKGIEGITPLQQTTTTLWSYPLIVGGIVTGIVILTFNKTWWMLLILIGSLPITLMQVVSAYQKYQRLKKIEAAMKEAELNKEETDGI
jgi:hypothetical protein